MSPRAESSIGPQLVSAYLDTVLVRPGARHRYPYYSGFHGGGHR